MNSGYCAKTSCPGLVVVSLFLEAFKNMWIWHLGTWFSGECGGTGVMVGLEILRWPAMNIMNISDQIQFSIQTCHSVQGKKKKETMFHYNSVCKWLFMKFWFKLEKLQHP